MSSRVFNRLKAKVTRADQLIQDFQLGVQAFLDSKPYAISINYKPEGTNSDYYVSKIAPVPDALAIVASDIVSNLRSVLDNLAYQLVVDARGGSEPDWSVYFPISKTAADYKGTRGGCIKGVRQEIIDAIDATEPYPGGKGHALWQINALNNIAKHRMPLEATGYSGGVDVSVDLIHGFRSLPGFQNANIPPIFLIPGKRFPLKLGDILFSGPAQPEVAHKRQFRIDIAIHAPGVIEPEPAIKTFKDFTNLVGSILAAFERFFP